MKKILLLLLIISSGIINAQENNSDIVETKIFTLEDVINAAKVNSRSFNYSQNKIISSYWRNENYKAQFLPRLDLVSTLPNYNRAISEITLPDGTLQYREQEYANTSVGLSISQNISFTGGVVQLSSSLNRLDNFSGIRYTNYNSLPFNLSYTQQSFVYNRFKWQRKIEPLVYEEAKRDLVEQIENISIESTNNFFNLMDAQKQLQIAEMNLANSDTLYKIAIERSKIGKIDKNELLQMELSFLKSKNGLRQKQINLKKVHQNFCSYLGIPEQTKIDLLIPQDKGDLSVDFQKALEKAEENRSIVLQFRRRRLQAEENIAKARAENSVSIRLSANMGFTQSGDNIPDVYTNLLDQQRVSLTLSIPLVDWGVSSSRVKMARADLSLLESELERENQDFNQEIMLQCMNLENLFDQLEIDKKSMEIANLNYEANKKKFLNGRLSINDLNIAQSEKDSAFSVYYSTLKAYWLGYFTIRKLTLYDFEKDQDIKVEMEIDGKTFSF